MLSVVSCLSLDQARQILRNFRQQTGMVSEAPNNRQKENLQCSLRRSNAFIERSSSRGHPYSTTGESSTPARRRRASSAISRQDQHSSAFARRASQRDTASTTPKPTSDTSFDPNLQSIPKLEACPPTIASTSENHPGGRRDAAPKMPNKLKRFFKRRGSQTNTNMETNTGMEDHTESHSPEYDSDMDLEDRRNALRITRNPCRLVPDSLASPVDNPRSPPPPQIQSRSSPNPQDVPRPLLIPQEGQFPPPSPESGDAPVSDEFGNVLKRVHAQNIGHSGDNPSKNSDHESRVAIWWKGRVIDPLRRRMSQFKGIFSKR